MIVDTHMHLYLFPEHFIRDVWIQWAPKEQHSWPDSRLKAAWEVPAERYLKLMEGHVDKALVVGSDFPKSEGVVTPNDWIASVVKQYPDKFAGVGCVDPSAGPKVTVKELERCVKELGFVGMKVAPPYQFFHMNDKELAYPLWAKAQELGVPIQVHAGFAYARQARLKYGNVLDIDDVALDFPEIKIVIVHFGHFYYRETVGLMQKHANVYTDISWLGLVSGMDRYSLAWNLPVVEENPLFDWLYPMLLAMSPTNTSVAQKIMFGTDFPASTPQRSIEIVRNINQWMKEFGLPTIPRATLDAIINRNWRQVYKLK